MKMLSFKHTDVFLLRGIKLLLFLIPFIPLYVSPSLVFPFITGKNFVFRTLVELAASLWLALVFINKKEWFRNSTMLTAVLGFTFIVGLADILGVNPYKSFWSNFERMEGYITILHLALYFILLKNVFRTKKDWKIFFGLLVAVSVFVSLLAVIIPIKADPAEGLSNYAMEYGTRARSTIGNPPFLAAYLLLSIFIGIILAINEKRYYLKYIFIASVLLNLAGIYMTATRGAILGIVLGMMTFIFLCFNRRKGIGKRNYAWIMTVVAISTLVTFALVFVLINADGLNDQYSIVYRFKTMLSDPSVLNRLDAWKMAVTAIKERPFLGWGQDNFIAIYTVNPIDLASEYIWLDRAHNIVIDWLVNAGVLGLLSYLAIFMSAFFVTNRAYSRQRINKIEGAVIASALVAYFVQNLSLFDTVNSYMIFFALIAYIDTVETLVEPLSEEPQQIMNSEKINAAHIYALVTALLLFSFVWYYLNYRPVEQNRRSVRMSGIGQESFKVTLDKYRNLLSFNTFGDEDVRRRMLMVSDYLLVTKNLGNEGTSEFVQATAVELWKEIDHNRHNLEYYYDLISFYSRIANYEPAYIGLAESVIKECQKINPRFYWLYMAMADIDFIRKDYNSAFKNVRTIAEMNPGNDEIQLKLALAAILISRNDIAQDVFEVIRKIRVAADPDIASGRKPVFSFFDLSLIAENYMLINDIQQALHYYKEALSLPNENIALQQTKQLLKQKSQAHQKISEIYLALGERKKAAQEAEKAEEIYLQYLSIQKGVLDANID